MVLDTIALRNLIHRRVVKSATSKLHAASQRFARIDSNEEAMRKLLRSQS